MTVTAAHPWYIRGANAVQSVWSGAGLPYGYACPQCGLIFEPEETGGLTREHVPSKAMGGKRMCLTCWDCNNYASTNLDSHVRQREHNLDFALGTMTAEKHITGRARVGDATATVWINSHGGPVKILLSTSQNPPGTAENLEAELRRLAAENKLLINLTFGGAKYDPDAASTAMLRYAYLTAFSIFGYYWAYGPACESVRAKIADPKSDPQTFGVIIGDAPPETRRVWIVREPIELQSIAVQIGRELIFLPRDRSDDEFYSRFATLNGDGTFQAEMRGTEAPWPDQPMHLDDFGDDILNAIIEGTIP